MFAFSLPQTTGGRVYPVRHYPIAIRLRDRKGRAILCVALYPQSGDSSGTTLGVRSVALLHPRNERSHCRDCEMKQQLRERWQENHRENQ